jgi:excisionase family DNA binding protein
MTVHEAAAYLRSTPEGIRALIKRQKIPFRRTPGGRILLERGELDTWVAGGWAQTRRPTIRGRTMARLRKCPGGRTNAPGAGNRRLVLMHSHPSSHHRTDLKRGVLVRVAPGVFER